MSDVLTLKVYDNPQDTNTEPGLSGIVSIQRHHIVDAYFAVEAKEYMVTTSGFHINGRSYTRWFPKTKVDNATGQPEKIKNQFVEQQVGELSGQPTAVVIRDDEQIKKIWDFLNPGEPCELLEYHQEFRNKMEAIKIELAEEQERMKGLMSNTGLVDTAGNPLTATNTGKLVDLAGEPIISGEETL